MFRVAKKIVLAGTLAGIAVLVGAAPGASQPKKGNFHVLYNFANGAGDGALPYAGLVQDSAGNFYGTTVEGGPNGAGTVFKLTRGGTESVLHAFSNGTDGGEPYANVILDSQGNLYGTTIGGGDDHACGCGVVFKIGTSGQETVLYTFLGGSDGAEPHSGLVFDKKGNLYGTTHLGGGACDCGTVYKLSPDGTETLLHAFAGGSDGAYPYYSSSLLIKHGNIYGTTFQGGGSCNCGTIFKIDSAGKETVLHAFTANGDGSDPETSLIADKAGNLYGTTAFGGLGGAGTVFKLAPDSTETVVYSFSGAGDGGGPQAGLVADRSGNVYGTTADGGASGAGTVFKLLPAGDEIVLYNFSGGSDGDRPAASLFLGAKNKLMAPRPGAAPTASARYSN